MTTDEMPGNGVDVAHARSPKDMFNAGQHRWLGLIARRRQDGRLLERRTAVTVLIWQLQANAALRLEAPDPFVCWCPVIANEFNWGPHRQQRLRAVEYLHLGFLVDTQHKGALRRRQVEPADVTLLILVATNKCLARSNKSRRAGEAT